MDYLANCFVILIDLLDCPRIYNMTIDYMSIVYYTIDRKSLKQQRRNFDAGWQRERKRWKTTSASDEFSTTLPITHAGAG